MRCPHCPGRKREIVRINRDWDNKHNCGDSSCVRETWKCWECNHTWTLWSCEDNEY